MNSLFSSVFKEALKRWKVSEAVCAQIQYIRRAGGGGLFLMMVIKGRVYGEVRIGV